MEIRWISYSFSDDTVQEERNKVNLDEWICEAVGAGYRGELVPSSIPHGTDNEVYQPNQGRRSPVSSCPDEF